MRKVNMIHMTALACLAVVLSAPVPAFAEEGEMLYMDIPSISADQPQATEEDSWEAFQNGAGSGYDGAAGPGVTGPGAADLSPDSAFASGDGTLYYEVSDHVSGISGKEDAVTKMTTITVPVWKLSGGVKKPGTASVMVNSLLAGEISQIFQEIYDGPQQFPISDVGGFSWRGDTSRSEHNGGTALDINSNSNYCVYANGTVVGDHWTPGEDPYSFSADCDVVKAFKNHGFAWGGDWPWANRDYMHFSYFGT